MRLLFLVLAWAAALWRAPAHADDPGHNGAIHTAAIHLVAPAPGAPGRDVAVIWLSGDGGWGRMERQMTARLAASGVATVGFSTLEYYAKTRTPAQGAALVARLESEAETRFGTHSFVLAGFSFGADVAPFVANALPAAMRARLVFVTLLSPGRRASFQVGPRTWLNLQDGPEVAPEIARIAPTRVLCIANAGVFDDVCPPAGSATLRTVDLAGGHVLHNQYDAITRAVLEEMGGR